MPGQAILFIQANCHAKANKQTSLNVNEKRNDQSISGNPLILAWC